MSSQDPDLAPAATARLDGRRLRSERTRQLIIEAYLALLLEHRRMPTSAEIAFRAGYSVRSIFERFSDLDALSLAAADYAIALGDAESVARDTEGDRATRIRSHVRTRAQACEKWLPLWRMLTAGPADEQVTDLRSRVLAVRRANRERVELMYRPELARLDPPAREAQVMALVTLTSFESWGMLREDFDMTFGSALDVWISAIDRILPEGP
ncbi:MAG: TetR/AcrR family transcriptional regulator [Reyranella sp.]